MNEVVVPPFLQTLLIALGDRASVRAALSWGRTFLNREPTGRRSWR